MLQGGSIALWPPRLKMVAHGLLKPPKSLVGRQNVSSSFVRRGVVTNVTWSKSRSSVSPLSCVLPKKKKKKPYILFSAPVEPSYSKQLYRESSPKHLGCLCPAALGKVSLPTEIHSCQNQSTSARHSLLCRRAQINICRGNSPPQIAREAKQSLGSVRKISIVLFQPHPENRN